VRADRLDPDVGGTSSFNFSERPVSSSPPVQYVTLFTGTP
jgi:hypothetical protein